MEGFVEFGGFRAGSRCEGSVAEDFSWRNNGSDHSLSERGYCSPTNPFGKRGGLICQSPPIERNEMLDAAFHGGL